jgi:RNA polymerase sigma-70 factor (ECF subfamily)
MDPGLIRALRAWLGPRHSALMPVSEQAVAATGWGELIQAIATRQDRAAFVKLFEHFAPRVKAFMLRSGAREATAEEIAQETMLSVWRKAGSFAPGSTGAAAWIFTIARNLRIDAARREKRERPVPHRDSETEDAAEPQIDESQLPEAQVATDQLEQRVRKAMAQLSSEQLRVIELSFFEDMPHSEIAKRLHIPLGTVKSRVRLAVGRLRALLGDVS